MRNLTLIAPYDHNAHTQNLCNFCLQGWLRFYKIGIALSATSGSKAHG
jgi:hypothetical protein